MSNPYAVAIVDDHTMIRKGLCTIVNSFANYQVMLDVANGKELLQKLDAPHLPDVVLLDIKMPEMDGYSTAAWLTKHYPDIRILALSTMDSETAIIRMIKSGARGYILKDAEPHELRRAFNDVLRNGYFFNEIVTHKVLSSIHEVIKNNADISGFVKLSEREIEFIKLACSEKSYHEIAREMFLSERTIDGYRESVFRKLNVSTRVGMVIYAIKQGLVKL